MSLLVLQDVGKEFGAIRALSHVNLTIKPGEVVGLMGDNGAGKSTLVKIIAGNFPPSHGRVLFEDREVHFTRPIDARSVGIEVVYQDLALADNLTAAANVFLGRELRRKVGPFSFLDHAGMNRRTAELFRELKSETRPDDVVRAMSGGQRQAVAVARAAAFASNVVILDEPTAALGVRESRHVLDLIVRLRDANYAVIVISHALDHVIDVADRAVVLRRGRKVGEEIPTRENQQRIVSLIVGGEG